MNNVVHHFDELDVQAVQISDNTCIIVRNNVQLYFQNDPNFPLFFDNETKKPFVKTDTDSFWVTDDLQNRVVLPSINVVQEFVGLKLIGEINQRKIYADSENCNLLIYGDRSIFVLPGDEPQSSLWFYHNENEGEDDQLNFYEVQQPNNPIPRMIYHFRLPTCRSELMGFTTHINIDKEQYYNGSVMFYENPQMMRKHGLVGQLWKCLNVEQKILWNRLVELLTIKGAVLPEKFTLSDNTEAYMFKVIENQFIVIDAPPGTGKTSTMKILNACLSSTYKSRVIVYSNEITRAIKSPIDIVKLPYNFINFNYCSTVCNFFWYKDSHLKLYMPDFDNWVNFFNDYARHQMFKDVITTPYRTVREYLWSIYQILETLLPRKYGSVEWKFFSDTKLIYLDEYTVISPWLIAVLIIFCKLGNINLIFLGDHHQLPSINNTMYHMGSNYDLVQKFTDLHGSDFSLQQGMRFKNQMFINFLKNFRQNLKHNNYGGGIQHSVQDSFVKFLFSDRLWLFERFPKQFLQSCIFDGTVYFFAYQHYNVSLQQLNCYNNGFSKQLNNIKEVESFVPNSTTCKYTSYEGIQVAWSCWSKLNLEILEKYPKYVAVSNFETREYYSSFLINIFQEALDPNFIDIKDNFVMNNRGKRNFLSRILLQVGAIYEYVPANRNWQESRFVRLLCIKVHKCKISEKPFVHELQIQFVDFDIPSNTYIPQGEPFYICREIMDSKLRNIPLNLSLYRQLERGFGLCVVIYQFALKRREFTFHAAQGLTLYGNIEINLNTQNKNAIYVALSRITTHAHLRHIHSTLKWSLLYTWYRNDGYFYKLSKNSEKKIFTTQLSFFNQLMDLLKYSMERKQDSNNINEPVVPDTNMALVIAKNDSYTFQICDSVFAFEAALSNIDYMEMQHENIDLKIEKKKYFDMSESVTTESLNKVYFSELEMICNYFCKKGDVIIPELRKLFNLPLCDILHGTGEKVLIATQYLEKQYCKWRKHQQHSAIIEPIDEKCVLPKEEIHKIRKNIKKPFFCTC